MTKQKRSQFKAWIGYSDGKPFTEHTIDEYGECITITIFRSRKDCHKRFADSRRVELTVEGGNAN